VGNHWSSRGAILRKAGRASREKENAWIEDVWLLSEVGKKSLEVTLREGGSTPGGGGHKDYPTRGMEEERVAIRKQTESYEGVGKKAGGDALFQKSGKKKKKRAGTPAHQPQISEQGSQKKSA